MSSAEASKRKGGGADAPDKRARDGGGQEKTSKVTDKEVDEFFSIIRRIHGAPKLYSARGNGRASEKSRDVASVSKSGGENLGSDSDVGRSEEEVMKAARTGLDLNAYPSPEFDPVHGGF